MPLGMGTEIDFLWPRDSSIVPPHQSVFDSAILFVCLLSHLFYASEKRRFKLACCGIGNIEQTSERKLQENSNIAIPWEILGKVLVQGILKDKDKLLAEGHHALLPPPN